MLREEAERLVRGIQASDAGAIVTRGMDLIRADCPEVLYPLARNAARRFPSDPRIQQLFGLAARGCGMSGAAQAAFARAAALAPGDALIAHSHARTALEAGQPAVALFDRARALAPNDGGVLLGRTAAQVQDGASREALEDLSTLVTANPLWIDGHRSLAHLAGQMGRAPDGAIGEAIARHPRNADLRRLHVATLLEARDLDGAQRAAMAATKALGADPWIARISAHIASEHGDLDAAGARFAALPPPADANGASLLARFHIRAGRPAEAAAVLDQWLGRDPHNLLWPYCSLAWRMIGDPRLAWLEGDPRLVGIYDIGHEVGDLAALAAHLRKLHFATAPPLDQSVRGGTQTDGNLLLREDPPIRALRAAIMRAVDRHVAQLPPPQPGHPTLLKYREPRRIAGSWSVRLTARGSHSDHVHQQGWFSSAFYVALPPTIATDDRGAADGWLTLGEQRDIAPSLPPTRLVEPRPGRLVLFPSIMWHGTRPFSDGERLTVALDISRPQQS